MDHKYKLKEAPGNDLPKVDEKGEFKIGDVKISGGIKSTIKDINKETGAISWDIEYIPNFEELFDDASNLVKTAKGVYTKAKTDDKLRLIYDEARVLRNKIRTHIRNEYPDEYRTITMKMSEGFDDGLRDILGDKDFEKVINTPVPSVASLSAMNDKRVEAVAKAIIDKYDIPNDSRLKGVIRVALSDYLEEMFSKNILDANEKEVEEMSTSGAAGAYLTPYAFRLNKKALGTDDDTYVKQLGYKLAPNQVK
jgi:hypothetical protein